MSFPLLAVIGFVFGIGFGYFVQRAGFCIAHGLGEIYMGKPQRILRFLMIIFIITGLGFVLTSYLNPSLGLKAVGEIRGFGFFNILSGIFFGAGILLNGGCILGTLRQIGEGNMIFLLVFISLIPGMALVVYVIDPILKGNYQVEKILLPQLFSMNPLLMMGIMAVGALIWMITLIPARKINK